MRSGFNLKRRLDELNIPRALTKRAAFGAAIICLVSLACFLYLPEVREMKRVSTRINRVEYEIDKAKEIRPASREAEKRQEGMESRLNVLIPSGRDYPELIREIARRARECNIQDISFKSGGELNTKVLEGEKEVSPEIQAIPRGNIRHFFIGLSFHSGFKDLARFLEEIQGADRLLEIESLVIKRNFPMISVEIVIIAYYRQRSEVGGQKSEVRSQRSEDGSQRSENGSQRSEDGYGNKTNKVCEGP